ncbi:MAG: NAD(P)/FAD-dependent oxidoreductase [Cyclobacteriaceae bacterium]
MKSVAIVGGGAAGFFCAIELASLRPDLSITIFEKSPNVLQKVKISGGGRCNVTHACFDPNELVNFYPRGKKELRGPFNRFCSGDTIDWFEQKGVFLKIEDDNRMFPTSNSSQTIIDCFWKEIEEKKIKVIRSEGIKQIKKLDTDGWILESANDNTYSVDFLVLTSGSSEFVWKQVKGLGHTIIPPVPSLFTFNIKHPIITPIPGLSVPHASLSIPELGLESEGPLLITHWGLSGPAILKLSAWGARELHQANYKFTLFVNWIASHTTNEVLELINKLKKEHPKKSCYTTSNQLVPKRLWFNVLRDVGIEEKDQWANISNKQLGHIANLLTKAEFSVNGKSTFKEEFVTAGGVDLKEINFKAFESKLHPNLFFAGEVLNIDAVTGGFNFQAAWTGAWTVSQAIAER